MKFSLLFFPLWISMAFYSQTSGSKIIIINNRDTTRLSINADDIDSVLSSHMKSIHILSDEEFEGFKDVQVELLLDSLISSMDQSVILRREGLDSARINTSDSRVVIINKQLKKGTGKPKIVLEKEISIGKESKEPWLLKEKNDPENKWSVFESEHASWAGFGIGINGFMNANDRFAQEIDAPFLVLDYAKSINFQFNVVEKRFPIYREYVGVTTGLGFQWNRYGLEKNVDVLSNQDSIYASINAAKLYQKNVLRSTYLQIPLLLELNSNSVEEKSWHLTLGVVGGIRIGSSWKTKWEESGKPLKAKTKDDYNFNSISANAYAQVGYGNLGLFVQYGLMDVFKASKGPVLSPISGGICFNF